MRNITEFERRFFYSHFLGVLKIGVKYLTLTYTRLLQVLRTSQNYKRESTQGPNQSLNLLYYKRKPKLN
jgi:hypothetical protein